jgi:hypothetical protein
LKSGYGEEDGVDLSVGMSSSVLVGPWAERLRVRDSCQNCKRSTCNICLEERMRNECLEERSSLRVLPKGSFSFAWRNVRACEYFRKVPLPGGTYELASTSGRFLCLEERTSLRVLPEGSFCLEERTSLRVLPKGSLGPIQNAMPCSSSGHFPKSSGHPFPSPRVGSSLDPLFCFLASDFRLLTMLVIDLLFCFPDPLFCSPFSYLCPFLCW